MNTTFETPGHTTATVSRDPGHYWLTYHAQKRMGGRGIKQEAIEAVLEYGRIVYIRGAKVFVVGRKEAERYRTSGVDLSAIEGVHVVCTPKGTTIITTYRNRDLRDLRPFRKRGRRRWR